MPPIRPINTSLVHYPLHRSSLLPLLANKWLASLVLLLLSSSPFLQLLFLNSHQPSMTLHALMSSLLFKLQSMQQLWRRNAWGRLCSASISMTALLMYVLRAFTLYHNNILCTCFLCMLGANFSLNLTPQHPFTIIYFTSITQPSLSWSSSLSLLSPFTAFLHVHRIFACAWSHVHETHMWLVLVHQCKSQVKFGFGLC